jgi:hypothetical protein
LDQIYSSFVHSKPNNKNEKLNKTKYVRDYLESQMNRSVKKENKNLLKAASSNKRSNTNVFDIPISRVLLEKDSNEKGVDFCS